MLEKAYARKGFLLSRLASQSLESFTSIDRKESRKSVLVYSVDVDSVLIGIFFFFSFFFCFCHDIIN